MNRFSGALAALILLIVLTAGFLPAMPAATGIPPAPSPTAGPLPTTPRNKIGLHTRLTDEPDPEKIRREFRVLREMGASWATEFFPWIYIQPTDRHRFDWQHADLVVDAANAEGIALLARLDGVPGWARPAGTTWKHLDPPNYGDFADFVRAFVARYKSRIAGYIIWNEPNAAAEWGSRKPDPQAYAALLEQAYRAAKQADPSALVLLAGMAPNLEGEASAVALNDLVYIDRLYDAGAGRSFDAVAVHSYGLQAPPSEPSAPDRLNFARAEQVHNVMLRRGDGAKPIYITEGGWNDSPRWSYAVKPYQRVQYTIYAYRLAEEWPWCRAVTLWMSRLPAPARTYFDNYTFLTPDFIPKAIYLEVQKYASRGGGG